MRSLNANLKKNATTAWHLGVLCTVGIELFLLNFWRAAKEIRFPRLQIQIHDLKVFVLCQSLNFTFTYKQLTEHSFTDCSALYRIPLELVKNRKLHNEKVFF